MMPWWVLPEDEVTQIGLKPCYSFSSLVFGNFICVGFQYIFHLEELSNVRVDIIRVNMGREWRHSERSASEVCRVSIEVFRTYFRTNQVGDMV
jgi:hypothetical protein